MDQVERLMAEGLIGVAEAAKLFGTFRAGKKTHTSTVTRWMKSGVKLPGGSVVKLESLRLGERLMTTRAAVSRFIAAQQPGVPGGHPSMKRTPAERERAAKRAEAELDRMGV